MSAAEPTLPAAAIDQPLDCAAANLMSRDLCLLTATLLLHILEIDRALQLDREPGRQSEQAAPAGTVPPPNATLRNPQESS